MKFFRNGRYVGFSREEFACSCGCGLDTVDANLLDALIEIKQYFNGAVVTITGGNRCRSRNSAVGGAEHSKHLDCKAADFKVSGVSADVVYNYCDVNFAGKYGVGKYDGRTHIDVRDNKARWGF